MAQPAAIVATYRGSGHATVTLRGQIDGGVAEEFDGHLDALLVAGVRQVTIDATAVTYCDPRVVELRRGSGHVAPRTGPTTVPGTTRGRWVGPRSWGAARPTSTHPEQDPR